MKNKVTGAAMLIFGTLIWGTSLAAQKLAVNHVGAFTFNAARFLIGALALLPFMLVSKYYKNKHQASDELKEKTRLPVKGGLICGCIIFVTVSLQQIGIIYTTVGKAGFITALYIIIVPVIGLFLGKHIAPQIWGCIFLAFIGMYLLCINEKFKLNLGDTLILICAFTTAAHILTIDFYSSKVDCIKLSCLQFLVCGVLSSAAAFIFEKPEWQSLLNASAPILYTGILSCGIAYTLQILGQKIIPPVPASLIFSAESVFSVLSGRIMFKEILSLKELSGCMLILVAIIISQTAMLWSNKTKTIKSASVSNQFDLK